MILLTDAEIRMHLQMENRLTDLNEVFERSMILDKSFAETEMLVQLYNTIINKSR